MSAEERIGIYGGSFDPPHLGHRNIVRYLLENDSIVTKIIIVPNKISVFKDSKYCSPKECVELCQLNFSDLDPSRVEISNIEISKDSPNYSYETILELKKIYVNYKVDLIIGEDQLQDLPNWKKFETILQETDRFVIFRRFTPPGSTIEVPGPMIGQNLYFCENPLWEESSSDWRKWPTERNLYPKVASKMIEFSSNKFNREILDKWLEVARKENTETRFDHVQKVSRIAKELASIHGYLFPEKAELAGILHDLTKQKNKEFHLEVFLRNNFSDYHNIPYAAWHAYSARFILEEEGIGDQDILLAVQSHTLGRKEMSLLESILYTSDFLGSDYAMKQPDYDEWVQLAGQKLQFGIYIKAQNTIRDLLDRKLSIHKNTLDVYNEAVEYLSQE